ncbi:putative FMRFamide perprohormone [Daphnia sinensis]|uniref:FMRFamide perprohormone n=1 Tax=Daphnia sinensis TaxID=1820382 RepID=A0AAD5KXJ1_9CRUS|nr:putative FMRFamide perprohormone [Daphnia sinensis]
MNGLRFLYVVLGLMMIVNVHQVRSDGEISDEDIDDELLNGAASSSEEDDNNKGIEYYLNAVKGLHQQRKRQEAESLVASRNSASTPIATLYRRSALNKNFIRFGRSGMMKTVSRQVQPTPPVRLMGLNESDGKDEEEQLSYPARPSRSLRSNFIRFGRSFFPSAASRSAATVHRSARAPIARRRMTSLVDLPTSLSSSRL